MDIPDDKGKTVREHLLFVYKKTGKEPSLLKKEPKSSPQEQNFLKLFWKIQEVKPRPDVLLSPNDILCWCQLYQHTFSSIEIDYLISLDRILVVEVLKTQQGK